MSDALGSFADTLRTAVSRRGLPLDRIRDRLEQRGVPLSAATLSYWQSGRSLPERKSSLAALPHLEDLLGLDPGSLSAALPETRDRSRRTPVRTLDSVWPEPPRAGVLRRLDTRWDAELDRVSLHDEARFGPDRRQQVLTVRQVLRARTDGPDRRVVMHCQDDLEAPLPAILPLHGCRIGRVVRDPASGVVGAELLLHRPLRRGQTVVVEYRLDFGRRGPREVEVHRRLRTAMRQYLLEVRFHPDALPVACEAFRADGPPQPRDLDAEGAAHLLEVDGGETRVGLRWRWDAAGTAPSTGAGSVNC